MKAPGGVLSGGSGFGLGEKMAPILHLKSQLILWEVHLLGWPFKAVSKWGKGTSYSHWPWVATLEKFMAMNKACLLHLREVSCEESNSGLPAAHIPKDCGWCIALKRKSAWSTINWLWSINKWNRSTSIGECFLPGNGSSRIPIDLLSWGIYKKKVIGWTTVPAAACDRALEVTNAIALLHFTFQIILILSYLICKLGGLPVGGTEIFIPEGSASLVPSSSQAMAAVFVHYC